MDININEVLIGFLSTIDAVKDVSAAQYLMAIGLFFISVTILSLIVLSRLKPGRASAWLIVLTLFSLILAAIFCAAGPSVAFVNTNKRLIPIITQKVAYENLRVNNEVEWLIRLIPYDPTDPKDKNELTISKLQTLGPPSTKYTFVGPYQELKGYTVADVVKKLGLPIEKAMHVSGIIFRLNKKKFKIYPASARGLLQVVREIEDHNSDIRNRLFEDHTLDDSEIKDLRNTLIPSWSWEAYRLRYPKYCQLAHRFRCGEYDASGFISGIRNDWHPIGISTSNKNDVCRLSAGEYCNATEWEKLVNETWSTFGSRTFFIQNIKIDDLEDRYLIEFSDPASQVIPEIGSSKDSQ